MEYPVVVEEWDGVRVVRDDLVPGGTKARVVHLLFDDREEYVYAGPCQGYAQVALAYACREHGKRATVFCAHRNERHARTVEAAGVGARIEEVRPGYLSVVRARALRYCAVNGAVMLPFGLFDRRVTEGIIKVAMMITRAPGEVWTVAGSGMLSQALQEAWPSARFNVVLVGQDHRAVGRARLWRAPERYEQDAEEPPPFPSCSNYDAKLWRFVREHASKGALMWNVAA